MVTHSFFVVRRKAIFVFAVDLYIYFATSNKMAIIGTIPFRFSDKNQELSKGYIRGYKLAFEVERGGAT